MLIVADYVRERHWRLRNIKLVPGMARHTLDKTSEGTIMPVVKIQGMRCPHYKSSVEKTLEAVPNAGNVIVRLEKGKAEWDGPALA